MLETELFAFLEGASDAAFTVAALAPSA